MEVTYYWAYDAGHSYPVAAIMKGSYRIFHWWKKNFTGLVVEFSLPFSQLAASLNMGGLLTTSFFYANSSGSEMETRGKSIKGKLI